MTNRKLIALETFPYAYGTRNLKPGDRFEAVSDRDADALVLVGRAKRDDSAEAEEGKSKRSYKRRDMVAEA